MLKIVKINIRWLDIAGFERIIHTFVVILIKNEAKQYLQFFMGYFNYGDNFHEFCFCLWQRF